MGKRILQHTASHTDETIAHHIGYHYVIKSNNYACIDLVLIYYCTRITMQHLTRAQLIMPRYVLCILLGILDVSLNSV